MKILVTGGLGNLGSWTTRHFLNLGHEVHTLSSRNRRVLEEYSFTRHFADVADAASIAQALEGQTFDAIIHLASVNEGNVPGYAETALRVNALGTRNMLQWCADTGQKPHFLYMSTFHAYGMAAGLVNESLTPAPRHDYGLTHLFAEEYVKQFHRTHGLPYTIFRLTNSYGSPLEKESSKWYLVLNDLCRAAVEQKQIKLASNGKPVRDFVWMGSVVQALELCMLKGSAQDVFNIGGGYTYTMLQVAEYVQAAYAEVTGTTLPILVNEADMQQHDQSLQVSISKLQMHINYTPENRLQEEARNIIKWLLQWQS